MWQGRVRQVQRISHELHQQASPKEVFSTSGKRVIQDAHEAYEVVKKSLKPPNADKKEKYKKEKSVVGLKNLGNALDDVQVRLATSCKKEFEEWKKGKSDNEVLFVDRDVNLTASKSSISDKLTGFRHWRSVEDGGKQKLLRTAHLCMCEGCDKRNGETECLVQELSEQAYERVDDVYLVTQGLLYKIDVF